MATVAVRLSACRGVVEPLQTATSVADQVEELAEVLADTCELPVTLIGHSWGAWLGFMLADRNPSMVRSLILVAAGPFEEKYAAQVMETRMSRLSEAEKSEFLSLQDQLIGVTELRAVSSFERFGQLMSKTDEFDPVPEQASRCDLHVEAFRKVWSEASRMRQRGILMECGKRILCPVLAIHGDFDPHPAEGVRVPLSRILPDFRFELLTNCGHTPWLEQRARDRFYELVESEINNRITQ